MTDNLALDSSDAVQTALNKITDRPRSSTADSSSSDTVKKSSSSVQRELQIEEEAPLVPTNGKQNFDNFPSRLGNPTADYEIQSELFAEGTQCKKTSNFATLMHLLKGNIGTGILAMPVAISNAGLLVGTLGIPILGVICIHCMHMLVNCSKILARRSGLVSLDFASTAENAFRHGPDKARPFARYARCAVNFMLMVTQFGFCCVYFLFTSRSIYEVVKSLAGYSPIPMKGYMAMLLPVMVVYNFIPTLERLAPATITANILQVSGLFMVLYFLLNDIPSINSVQMVAPVAKWPLYFGAAMYAFEGIGVVLPLENEMITPEDFRGCAGVLNTGMTIVACLYTAVGFYGYLKFGSNVKDSITFNITAPIVGEVIRLMFAVAIFLSYALQFYVPIKVLWPVIKKRFSLERFSAKRQLMFELMFRTFLVTLTFVLAVAIPMLNLFIALVGASASSSLALIFPPIIEMMTIWKSNMSRKLFIVTALKDFFIMTLGITGCILGTYTSVKEIVRCFHVTCE